MEATLHALGGILLNALPTFVLVILLHIYLKYVFFRPLGRVLQARADATEGARKRAEELLEQATLKTHEYEAAMRAARAEVYQEQEALHQRLEQERAAELEAAQSRTEGLIREAQEKLSVEVVRSKEVLQKESARLADSIIESILGRKVA